MARMKQLTKEEKRLETLAVKTEEQKKALVDQLRRTPIVQLACERTSVGRSTYYKWRAHDKVFARAAEKALEAGRFFVNDLAESKIIRMIQDDNLTAIIFWLKHNHPKYAVTARHIHEYEAITERPSVEEMNVWAHEFARVQAKKFPRMESVDEMRDRIEEELEEAEREAPERKRIEAFEEDSEEE
ncbi:hypothetical protein A3I27_03895 [Candidatus Giovannonibacteria bacterium RIFCSPLOWO2_02_FULL_43_11b]|nr:MAG: hypothetical protein A3B97_04390 [Candidatus Giovannonibacteria bacterium RIFCSPHIGHO2_02_FULL_43_32]OGF89122.1 MAG: hypothetical protein A3I27_03895 [Candidatus Giovannonibacteria bacterium RIFCSPLOWO2_02_FULL_43_11b]OGI90234.1 MAG: hypothetical protein A3B01_01515 [Candidatus Nomurabacteria bacterium RIFCSPLOWO2_01_FULL_41_52b]